MQQVSYTDKCFLLSLQTQHGKGDNVDAVYLSGMISLLFYALNKHHYAIPKEEACLLSKQNIL